MNLAVLGDRVFIRPDTPVVPDTAIVITDQQDLSLTRGTVVAVGEGPEFAHRVLTRALKHLTRTMGDIAYDDTRSGEARAVASLAIKTAESLQSNYAPDHLVMPGDRVLFAPDSGEEIRCEDEILFVMKESDILAVID